MNDLQLPFHPTIPGMQALGFTSRGPIWPVMGGSQPLGDPAGDPPPADPPSDSPPVVDPPNPDPNSDRGFPPNTPWRDMTAEQQVNYWKFHDRQKSNTLSAYDGITPEQAKKWKQDAEEAARANQTPSERALEDARNEARAAGRTEADSEWAGLMTEAVVEQFVTDPAQRQAVLGGLNPTQFMTDDKFDKDKLVGHLTGLAAAFGGASAGEPPPRQWGQAGSQPPATSGSDEGLAEAKRRGFIK